ncbi:MAG: DUF1467 family protein [Rhodospirillales bacterium]|nr:DUF1467 family protein [Rhodospirillales bacterium]
MDQWFTGLSVFLILWWLVLFMVLPWGIHAVDQEDVDKGHAPSAPKKPRILIKMGVTTAIAAVIWVICYFIAQSGWIDFRNF